MGEGGRKRSGQMGGSKGKRRREEGDDIMNTWTSVISNTTHFQQLPTASVHSAPRSVEWDYRSIYHGMES